MAEWVLDAYASKLFDEKGSTFNPLRIPEALYPRVVRGGSFESWPEEVRSASRNHSSADWKKGDPEIPKDIWWNTHSHWVGFRVVRPLREPTPNELKQKWDKQSPERQREKWLKRSLRKPITGGHGEE